jgi:arginase family enzyme
MEWSDFLNPVNIFDELRKQHNRARFGDLITAYQEEGNFPSLEGMDIAIVGVEEARAATTNKQCDQAPNAVRKYLYELFPNNPNIKIVDVGNIKRGFELPDTYVALSAVLSELLYRKIVPIIIGGSHDLAYANYLAYENIEKIINIVDVDAVFDIGETEDENHHRSYLSKIILHQPNFLFNLTNIGHQSYLTDQQGLNLIRNLLFDAFRLGTVKSNMEEVEPMVRNADMISIDISSVRMSDAPGNENALPNGFYGEDLCRIARYAGVSDKLTSFGIYEVNPELDVRGQTCHLTAQIIWYFIDGFYERKNDFPADEDKANYLKYTVKSDSFAEDMIFHKSTKSDRWWVEIPCSEKIRKKYRYQYFVPCSYNDYLTACKNEVPERWLRVYEKLM